MGAKNAYSILSKNRFDRRTTFAMAPALAVKAFYHAKTDLSKAFQKKTKSIDMTLSYEYYTPSDTHYRKTDM